MTIVKPVGEMTMAEMVKEYNELSNSNIKRFADRKSGERRLANVRANAVVKQVNPASRPSDASVKKRSAGIRESWNDRKVAAARSQRDRVHVEGHGDFRSTHAAFVFLKLPMNRMIKFRLQVKKDREAVFEWKNQQYYFAIISQNA